MPTRIPEIHGNIRLRRELVPIQPDILSPMPKCTFTNHALKIPHPMPSSGMSSTTSVAVV